MFGTLRKAVFGSASDSALAHPPALVIARRERSVGDKGWFEARSWLGGQPKLDGQAWPRGYGGKPLHFLAQLDLAEVARASGGRTALPTQGALAFFVGRGDDELLGGRILRLERAGAAATPIPDDLDAFEDVGGDPALSRTHRFGPRYYPHWPVEFRELKVAPRPIGDDDEALELALNAQDAAISRHYARREYDFSAPYLAKEGVLGEAPLPWLTALLFAELAPDLQKKIGGMRAHATSKPDAARKLLAKADAEARALDAFVDTVAAAAANPWRPISPQEAERLDAPFREARTPALAGAPLYYPWNWRDCATDAIKLMASGPELAFAQLPQAWRDVVNARYRLPVRLPHLMFGAGADLQGNAMFQRPDMRMVLQLGHDDMMYWPFGDNGVYQFWMPAGALKTADVTQAQVTFECH